MFTGLVEGTGRLESVRRQGGAVVMSVSAPFAEELSTGDSVAVNGVCLTVVRSAAGAFEVEPIERTLAMTTLRRLRTGAAVNLERPVALGDPLGGHMVTGHVDGIGLVTRVTRAAGGRDVTVELPRPLLRHVAERGSITLDGVSLTVAAVSGTRITVSLIPETLATTVAASYRPGAFVNVETDIIAKYQESIAAHREGSGLTLERLRELGFTE